MLDSLKMFHSLGLHDGEIFSLEGTRTVYEYSQKILKTKTFGIDTGFGIRVLKNKKLGFSFCNSKEQIPAAIKRAISISSFSDSSPFSFAQRQKYRPAEAFDRKIADADEKEMLSIVGQIEDGVKKHAEPVRIVLVSQREESALANTSLLFAKERSTSLMAFAEAKNGNGFGSSDYAHYKALKDPYALGEKAGLMAKEMKNPKKLPAGKYSVIFSQETLSSLLSLLLYSFSGELKRRKISKLWNQEGERLFHEKFTLFDDPFADAAAKSAFDGEGVSSRRTVLIDKGNVNNFLYTRECAAFSGINAEGNCARAGYSLPPSIGDSNTVIEAGDAEPRKELGKYLFIESMHGLHTANQLSGDFGAEASIAFLHEKGKILPVRGFMVSENIFKLFNRIEYIGKKQEQSGNLVAPSIAFSDVSIIS
ncbi:MAG: TldD/PmbA family protein [Candidatus ainarchaeum sp.]|nr:TldD/PmbA family protein [Candidatus ainarchaeum sp.]